LFCYTSAAFKKIKRGVFLLTTNILAYATTNVTTSAYVTLVASTSSCSKLQITDTSGQLLKLATGIAGSEVDICTCTVSGSVIVPIYIPAGQRLSIKAVSASATTGFNAVSFL